jgi:transposase InsO family protein
MISVRLMWRMMKALCLGCDEQWLAAIDYLAAENQILQRKLSESGQPVRLNDDQRLVLATLGERLKPAFREAYVTIVRPATLLAWYRRLVTARYDSSTAKMRTPGRPPTAATLKELICRIARENSSWGYTRIGDQLRYLGHEIGRTTIADILRDAGLTPDPELRRQRTWSQFIAQHRSVIWATDFLTVDTLSGCLYVLFFIQLHTRRVVLGGITEHPHDAWMQQIARNLTDPFDGPLLGARYLLHDRDAKYTATFDRIFPSASIKPTKLPARSPNLNPVAERWVLSIKSEALGYFTFFGERQVRRVLREYLAHYHQEPAHQDLDGRNIDPGSADLSPPTGPVARRERLGGLLSFYHREAA